MSDKIDQIFDLLEKVYTKLQDTKKEVKENSSQISKLSAVIENGIKSDIKTLYEMQVQTCEHLERIDKKLEEHDRRFDVLEVKVDALLKTMKNRGLCAR